MRAEVHSCFLRLCGSLARFFSGARDTTVLTWIPKHVEHRALHSDRCKSLSGPLPVLTSLPRAPNTLSDTPWQRCPEESPCHDRLPLEFPVWEGERILASSDSSSSPLTGVLKTIRQSILFICFDPQALDLQPDINKLNALLSCQAGPLCESLSAPLLPSSPWLPPLRNLYSRPLTGLSLSVGM